MIVEQICVFLENKSGRLSEVTRAIEDAGVNIRALSVADTSDFGILRMIVNDNDKAMASLKAKNFTVSKAEVVAAEVSDSPGGLSGLLNILEKEGINIEYMYAFLEHVSDKAVMIFRFDENSRAVDTLTANNIILLSGEQVYSL